MRRTNLRISFPIARTSVVLLLAIVIGSVLYVRFASKAETSSSSQRDLEVELVTLRPFGFEPTEISRRKGGFILFVDDRTGKEGSLLRLKRVTGESLRDVETNRKGSGWRDVFDLPPGNYVLTDAGNPDSSCRIIILP